MLTSTHRHNSVLVPAHNVQTLSARINNNTSLHRKASLEDWHLLIFFRCYVSSDDCPLVCLSKLELSLRVFLDLTNHPTESDSSDEHPDAHCRAFSFLIVGRGKPEVQGRQTETGQSWSRADRDDLLWLSSSFWLATGDRMPHCKFLVIYRTASSFIPLISIGDVRISGKCCVFKITYFTC